MREPSGMIIRGISIIFLCSISTNGPPIFHDAGIDISLSSIESIDFASIECGI